MPPQVIAYSSARWPCGIADYHRRLAPYLPAPLHTVTFPVDRVLRDRPLALARRRRMYRQLAAEGDRFDAALIQCATGWNSNRLGESLLPIFTKRLRPPALLVLHEWPEPLADESAAASWPARTVREWASRIVRARDFAGLSFEDWMRTKFFPAMAHIVVHAEHLLQDLLALGVPRERITYSVLPGYPIERAAAPDARFCPPGARVILLFGFPHPRKNYELAVRALARLPPDVVVVLVGSTEGAFRSAYADKLRQLAREVGVADRLILTGEISETQVAEIFARTDVALSPSRYITGSASLGYLIAAGVPVVASDLTQVVALRDAGAGIELFPAGDLEACVAALERVLGSEDRRRELVGRHEAFARTHTFNGLGEVVTARLEAIAGRRAR